MLLVLKILNAKVRLMMALKLVLNLTIVLALLAACTPATDLASQITEQAATIDTQNKSNAATSESNFDLTPVPQENRWIVAVPNFEVRTGSVKIGQADLQQEGGEFFKELGSGVADVFVTEAFRSQQFRLTERAELEKVIFEQDLATSGRVDSETAAEVGRITGAELIVLGSLSEFNIDTTGGGGKVLGIFGGSAETVTANVSVDIRIVDSVTAEILAIGIGRDSQSQTNIQLDVLNVIKSLQAGRTGTTLVDVAVRNAIRAAITEAALSLPPKNK